MVTIAITYFVRAALNRAIYNELINTKFDDFLKGLAGYFLNFKSLCNTSRLTIVSREAKKQAVRDEQVSYLHVAPL